MLEYAKKCRSELCRNCVRWPRNRRQTPTFTGSHREAFCGRKSLNRLLGEVFRCCLVMLATIAFQACSFNHSDISPLENQRVADGLEEIIAHAGTARALSADPVQILAGSTLARLAKRRSC